MKRPKPPSIITVAIITTITIIFWIFFSVYQILTGEPDVDIPAQLLKPINPTLNQEVLSSLSSGVDYDKDSVTHFTQIEGAEEQQVTETQDAAPTTTPSPSPDEINDNIDVSTPAAEPF